MLDDATLLRQIIDMQSAITEVQPDLSEVMRVVAERAQDLTGAVAAVVELADGDELVYRAATGSAAAHLGLRLAAATSLSGLSVRTGEVLSCADTETDPRVDRDAARRVGARSMVVTPLLRGSEVVGVLKVMSGEPAAFDDLTIEVLGVLASFISGAIVQAEAFGASMEAAMHDHLTGLPNRALLLDRMRQSLARASRSGATVAVCFVDLDGFKPVNDRFGHAAGDAVLVEVAHRLTGTVRDADTVARLGGDEFVIVVSGVSDDRLVELDASIRSCVREPIATSAGAVTVDASVGIATTVGDDPTDPMDLMAAANQAMYEDKRARVAARAGEPRG